MKTLSKGLCLLAMLSMVTFFSACKKEEPALTASVNVVPATSTDLTGSVTGDGGSTTKILTWNNSQTTANYNMYLSSAQGSFRMVVKDAAGKVTLDNTLVKDQTSDSKSGITGAGTAGNWTVEITLSSFTGKGDFSLNAAK